MQIAYDDVGYLELPDLLMLLAFENIKDIFARPNVYAKLYNIWHRQWYTETTPIWQQFRHLFLGRKEIFLLAPA